MCTLMSSEKFDLEFYTEEQLFVFDHFLVLLLHPSSIFFLCYSVAVLST